MLSAKIQHPMMKVLPSCPFTQKLDQFQNLHNPRQSEQLLESSFLTPSPTSTFTISCRFKSTQPRHPPKLSFVC